jgi:hypothetical protein
VTVQLGLTVRPARQVAFWFRGPDALANLAAWRHWHARLWARGETGGVGCYQPRRQVSAWHRR